MKKIVKKCCIGLFLITINVSATTLNAGVLITATAPLKPLFHQVQNRQAAIFSQSGWGVVNTTFRYKNENNRLISAFESFVTAERLIRKIA